LRSSSEPALTRREAGLIVGLGLIVGALFLLYGRINHGPARWSARTPIDDLVPLVVPAVLPYVSIYALGALTVVVLGRRSPRLLSGALVAAILALVTSYVVYVAAQTTVERPIVTGDDPFSQLLRVVYAADEPYNAFPSLHVAFSTIVAIYWLRSGHRLAPWVVAWCGLIAASTVLVHQHYIADVVGGVVVGGAASLVGQRAIRSRRR
jgi:membrane-associated phospholipid phosphatase